MKLFHYCSNNALISILSHRELWASEFSMSNDVMEGRWIRKIFQDMLTERNVRPDNRDRLISQLDLLLSMMGGVGFCMSEQGDMLSQWRAYADNGAGVSIAFNKEYLEHLAEKRMGDGYDFSFSINQIEYEIDKQKESLSENLGKILDLVSQGAFRFPTILTPETNEEKKQRLERRTKLAQYVLFYFPHIYQVKNPAFAEEREWRLISFVFKQPNGNELRRLEFRSLEDRIVPYRRISLEELDQSAIEEILIGPRNVTPVEIFEAALARYGWQNVQVRKSAASYR